MPQCELGMEVEGSDVDSLQNPDCHPGLKHKKGMWNSEKAATQ